MTRSAFRSSLPVSFAVAALGAVTMTMSCVPDAGVVVGDAAAPDNATSGSGNRSGGTGGRQASGGGADGGATTGTGGQTGSGGTGGGISPISSGGTQGGATGGRAGAGGRGGTGTGGISTTATGGRIGTGGAGTGTGGRGTGGAGTGGAGTGGAPVSTTCGTLGTARNGNGSFTFYYFGQGTFREGNGFRTACGYFGTESGQTDTVENIAAPATYFVAIPGVSSANFDTVANCGACVELTGQNGTRIVATVIDECPRSTNPLCVDGHLDVSTSAFNQLGFSVGNPSGTSWRFVPCPVTGRVKIRVKTGNPNEIFVENSILAIRSVSLNGTQATRMSYGAWHFNSNLTVGQSLLLTDAAGRMITVQVASTTQNLNQDTGQQFPACQ